MVSKELLTNEELSNIYSDNFQLAVHSIQVAQYYIRAGKDFTVSSLLEEIRKNPKLLDIPREEIEEQIESNDYE